MFVNIRTGSYKDVPLPPAEPAGEPAAELVPAREIPSFPEVAPEPFAYEEVVLLPEELPAPPPAEGAAPMPAESPASLAEEE